MQCRVARTNLKLGLLLGIFVCALVRSAKIDRGRVRNETAKAIKVIDEIVGFLAYLVENGPPCRLAFSVVKMKKIEKLQIIGIG